MVHVYNVQVIVLIVHQVVSVILVVKDILSILMDFVMLVQNNAIVVHLLVKHLQQLVQHAKIHIM